MNVSMHRLCASCFFVSVVLFFCKGLGFRLRRLVRFCLLDWLLVKPEDVVPDIVLLALHRFFPKTWFLSFKGAKITYCFVYKYIPLSLLYLFTCYKVKQNLLLSIVSLSREEVR